MIQQILWHVEFVFINLKITTVSPKSEALNVQTVLAVSKSEFDRRLLYDNRMQAFVCFVGQLSQIIPMSGERGLL